MRFQITELEPGYDLNQLNGSGIYHAPLSTNGPSNNEDYFILVFSAKVLGVSTDTQLLLQASQAHMYYRSKIDGVWQTYEKLSGSHWDDLAQPVTLNHLVTYSFVPGTQSKFNFTTDGTGNRHNIQMTPGTPGQRVYVSLGTVAGLNDSIRVLPGTDAALRSKANAVLTSIDMSEEGGLILFEYKKNTKAWQVVDDADVVENS